MGIGLMRPEGVAHHVIDVDVVQGAADAFGSVAKGADEDAARGVVAGGPDDDEGVAAAVAVGGGEEGLAVEVEAVGGAVGIAANGGEFFCAVGKAEGIGGAGFAIGGGEEEGGGVFFDVVDGNADGLIGASEGFDVAGGVVEVAEVIGAFFFDDHEEGFVAEELEGFGGHFSEGGGVGFVEGGVGALVDFEGEVVKGVGVGEDAEEFLCGGGDFEKLVAGVGDGVALFAKLGDEVAAIGAFAGSMTALFSFGDEVGFAATEDDINAGLGDLEGDGVVIFATGDGSDEGGSAGFGDVAGVDEGGAKAAVDGFLHKGLAFAGGGDGWEVAFGVQAKGFGMEAGAGGVSDGSGVGGGGELVGEVTAIDGDVGEAIPMEVGVWADEGVAGDLPSGEADAVGMDEDDALGVVF